MNPNNQLRFALSDRLDDGEITPSHIPLAMLSEFQKDVGDFLKGSNRDVDLSQVLISIEQGSLALVASELHSATTLWADLAQLNATHSLDLIDPKRASVIERWQLLAQKNPHRHYSVADNSSFWFVIDSSTNFNKAENTWVHVEKYLHGVIFDIGGNTKANVHIKLENGLILPPIASSQDYLEKNGQNRLYRSAMLHVTAEENLQTGELRNLNLIGFETHQPSYDEDEFNRMVERGTQAWANVENSAEWLETLRGGKV